MGVITLLAPSSTSLWRSLSYISPSTTHLTVTVTYLSTAQVTVIDIYLSTTQLTVIVTQLQLSEPNVELNPGSGIVHIHHEEHHSYCPSALALSSLHGVQLLVNYMCMRGVYICALHVCAYMCVCVCVCVCVCMHV